MLWKSPGWRTRVERWRWQWGWREAVTIRRGGGGDDDDDETEEETEEEGVEETEEDRVELLIKHLIQRRKSQAAVNLACVRVVGRIVEVHIDTFIRMTVLLRDILQLSPSVSGLGVLGSPQLTFFAYQFTYDGGSPDNVKLAEKILTAKFQKHTGGLRPKRGYAIFAFCSSRRRDYTHLLSPDSTFPTMVFWRSANRVLSVWK